MKRNLWNGEYIEPSYWDETADALIAMTDLQPGMRVLDVGSAGGGTLFPALERIGSSGSIVGIEMEEDWVEWLQKRIAERGISNAENLLMDARTMSFPDASFDAVIVGLVGLDDDYDFDRRMVLNEAPLMSEVSRVLRPGQRLYVSDWLLEEDNEWMGQLVRRQLSGCTKRGYFPMTEEGFTDLLQSVGFEDIRTSRFDGAYRFADPGEWMACIGHIWEKELSTIRADQEMQQAFERDALNLLGGHAEPDGTIPYRRSATLVSARKPAA